jgi:hypothetical protein
MLLLLLLLAGCGWAITARESRHCERVCALTKAARDACLALCSKNAALATTAESAAADAHLPPPALLQLQAKRRQHRKYHPVKKTFTATPAPTAPPARKRRNP